MRRTVLAALVSLFVATSALAQGNPPKLTWLRYYKVNDGAELLRLARERLDPLVTQRKVVAWGLLTPVTRIDDDWSHVLYITIQDWAAAEGIVGAIEMPVRAERIHDVVLRHISQSGPPKGTPRYVVANEHPVSRGRDSDALALFNEWAKPVFLELEPHGLGPWGLSVQNIAIDNRWTYMAWYFMTDLSILDRVEASLLNMGSSKLGTFERRLREMSEDDYRGQILKVVYATP